MAHIGLYLLLLMMVVVVVLSETTSSPTTTSTLAPTKSPVDTPAPDTMKEAVGAVLSIPKSLISACAEVTKVVLGPVFSWGK